MKLVKFFAVALWALGAALASAAYADPPAIIGRLNYLTGPVSFAPGEAPDDWTAATLNRPVTSGDRLWTDDNAFAEMRVGSLAVRVAPKTSMDVLGLDDRAIQLRVPEGNVNLRVRRLSGDRFIEVATPTGSVVIRQPGTYRISVDPNGDSTLVGVRTGGQAEVFTADASVIVRDNEEAELSGSRLELYAASQPDEFDRWCGDRDQRLDRVASTRYVSSEMTGYEDLDSYGEWRTVADYGNVWVPSSVPAGWAPYRDGHWVWVSPWGWTWVDDQPWGFAPSHYGRWIHVNNYWAWTPGRIVERPVYSPALVAFIGGSNLSVGVSTGPAVGWIPLGYREPYIPWYSASQAYVRNVNVAYVTNVTNITNVTNVRYVNRSIPNAVTVVPRETFVSARPVQRDLMRITDDRRIAAAPVTHEPPVARPTRTSLARSAPGQQPPAQVTARQALTVYKPAESQREFIGGGAAHQARATKQGQRAQAVAVAQTPPVRVIERREPTRVPVQQTPPRAENRAARQVTQAPRADAPTPQPGLSREEQTRRQEQAREQDGARQREQKSQQADQQKAQAVQQLDKLERDRKQDQGQAEQQRRADLERDQQQKAAQDQQRQRQEQERAQRDQQQQQKAAQDQQRQRQEQDRVQRDQQQQQRRADLERDQQQKAAQDQQRQRQEQERAQRDQQQQQKAAQDQQRQRQEQERAQRDQQQQQKAAQDQQRQRQEQDRVQRDQQQQQKAAQDQQRQRQEQERAQREQQSQKAAQEQQRAAQQQRAQQEQQRAAQEQQRAQQEQQRAQQQRAQQDQQKAAQEQQRAAQQQQQAREQQQAAQQQRAQAAQQQAREQQRAQPQKPDQKPEPQEKGKRREADKES